MPTIDSIATTIPPPKKRVRLPLEFDTAMKTMTPIDPVRGSTVARTLEVSCATTASGGALTSIDPDGRSGESAELSWLSVIRRPETFRFVGERARRRQGRPGFSRSPE